MYYRDLNTVRYRGQDYKFSARALGGTAEEPRLKPADELLLDWLHEANAEGLPHTVALYHDHWGVLTVCAAAQRKVYLSDNLLHGYRKKAHHKLNFGKYGPKPTSLFADPLPGADYYLMHLPKTLDLFEFYLATIVAHARPGARVAVAFATKHFTPRAVSLAERYAGRVTQSKAYKKARLLLLDDLQPAAAERPLLREMTYGGVTYRQYPGVFSAGHIDYATQFLLDEWSRNSALLQIPPPARVVDYGCGNGVIGDQLLRRYPAAQLQAVDISEVAVASARLNLAHHGTRARVYQTTKMSDLGRDDWDLVVTNPPFHDGHRVDIETSLRFFEQTAARLTAYGCLVVVANRHLNYATHLRRMFGETLTVAENEKYVVYRCR